MIVKQWTDFAGDSTSTAVRHHRLALTPELVKPGQTVLIRAVAWDKRAISDWGLDLKPQETASGWHAIKIVAEDAKSAAALEQLDSLRAAIWKILERQLRARATAGDAAERSSQLAESHRRLAAEIRAQQIGIQKTSVELVSSIGPSDREERLKIKRILNGLAFGDMLQAVARCDELEKLKAPGPSTGRPPN